MMRVRVLALVAIAGCAGEPSRPSPRRYPRSEVAAEVEGTQILVRDVAVRMRRDRLGAREALMKLVDEELAIQASRRRGLLRDSDVAFARKQVLVRRLLETEVESRIGEDRVSEAQIAQEYRNAEALTADHILVKLEADAPDGKVSVARELAKRIRAAAAGVADEAAFAELVSQFSAAGLEVVHQDLGEFFRGSGYLDELVDQALKLTRPGEVSDAFRTEFGWHVVRLRSRRNLLGPALEVAKPEIVQTVLNRLRRARYEEVVGALEKRARIRVNDDLLARIEGP